jgi:hypothetical protein
VWEYLVVTAAGVLTGLAILLGLLTREARADRAGIARARVSW